MGDDSEWMKLPTNQKCEHKVVSSHPGLIGVVFVACDHVQLIFCHFFIFSSIPGLESAVKRLHGGSAALSEDYR